MNSARRKPISKASYQFQNEDLKTQALTHRSAGSTHNERLEFLGDAIIGLVVAEYLYAKFPAADEGQLTRTRASLVNRESLARVARDIDIGSDLILGEGERKSGGWKRDSILSNTVEAMVGAIYLDGGLETCREQIHGWFAETLESVDPSQADKDPKTRLQEWLQARQLPLPNYETIEIDGPSHAQIFTVSCTIASLDDAVTATGTSRRKAEQKAAEMTLEAISDNG